MASARSFLFASATQTVAVTLTRAGQALLRAEPAVRLRVTATLAGATARPIGLTRAFTLAR